MIAFVGKSKVTYIEAIIVVEEELELGSPVASGAAKDTESDSSG